jgi:hypothetical protein
MTRIASFLATYTDRDLTEPGFSVEPSETVAYPEDP